MNSLIQEHEEKVFRDKVKEHRGSYYVTYQPADARFPFAIIQVVFLEDCADVTKVKTAMEYESRYWLKRYPVPVMVSAFDARDSLICLSEESVQSHLMGYVDDETGEVVLRWGLLDNNVLPSKQMGSDYLARIYDALPFRFQKDVREEAIRKARANGKGIRIILFLILGVPVLIELVSLGMSWLGNFLAAISISVGLYKYAKAIGWLKPTKKEREKAEKELRMKHYFYHCEKNPEAFNRLKYENFECESIEQTHKESEEIRGAK